MGSPLGTSGNYTAVQLAALLSEMQNDPLKFGYAPYVAGPDLINLAIMLNAIRDGATQPKDDAGNSLVTGPSGTITGATNASPIVIATSAPHGLATGMQVVIGGVGGNTAANNVPPGLLNGQTTAPNPSWVITVVDATHFSLNGSTGNAAYTSGGTWAWCASLLANASKVFNQSVSVASILANILPSDAAAATALTGTQANILPAFLNPAGSVQLTDTAGNELNAVAWLNVLTTAGSVSHKAVKALETRFVSRGEQILNLPHFTSPGLVATGIDVQAAFAGHY